MTTSHCWSISGMKIGTCVDASEILKQARATKTWDVTSILPSHQSGLCSSLDINTVTLCWLACCLFSSLLPVVFLFDTLVLILLAGDRALFNSFLVLFFCNLMCNFYHFFICYCMHGFLGYQIFVSEETLCWNNYLSVYQVFGIRKYHPLLITLVVYTFDCFFFLLWASDHE